MSKLPKMTLFCINITKTLSGEGHQTPHQWNCLIQEKVIKACSHSIHNSLQPKENPALPLVYPHSNPPLPYDKTYSGFGIHGNVLKMNNLS